jgi:hypothetical protein
MEHVNDNARSGRQQRPLIQVLVPACRTINQPGTGYAWLNGYCVLSCRVEADGVVVGGEVRIGEHLAENSDLIGRLAHILNPGAVLSGMDLTRVLSGLGRLPIDAVDPAPALALLTMLRNMLEKHRPIDLIITPESRNAVLLKAKARDLGSGRSGLSYQVGQQLREDVDSGNPHLLAEMLADHASACLLAISTLTLPEVQRVKLEAAWRTWRQSLVPFVSGKEVPPDIEP